MTPHTHRVSHCYQHLPQSCPFSHLPISRSVPPNQPRALDRSVTFHGSICMCLTACVCPWEESVKGQEEKPLGNTGSNPEATHRGAGCQGVTNPNPWSFLAPLRAQPGSPSSPLTPIYPRSPPGRGTLTLREQGSFVPGSEGGDGRQGPSVGWERAAGIHVACWEC